MQDQKVRLELDKKLAASSQKFAEAAKLSNPNPNLKPTQP